MRLEGGFVDTAAPVQREDIYKRIEQKINEQFKIRHFAETLASGETLPENLAIATYENIAVTVDGVKSKSILPTTPIALPKNMGIYLVYDPKYPDVPFIPLGRGQTALLRTDTLLNDVFGMIAYEPKNTTITYNRDLTLFGVNVVTIELVVMDLSLYSETEYLPIPSDYESKLIEELVQEFSGVTPESGLVNKNTTAGNQTR